MKICNELQGNWLRNGISVKDVVQPELHKGKTEDRAGNTALFEQRCYKVL